MNKHEKLQKELLKNGWGKIEENTHGNEKAYFYKKGTRIDINGDGTYSVYKNTVIICENCYIDISNYSLRLYTFIHFKDIAVIKNKEKNNNENV